MDYPQSRPLDTAVRPCTCEELTFCLKRLANAGLSFEEFVSLFANRPTLPSAERVSSADHSHRRSATS